MPYSHIGYSGLELGPDALGRRVEHLHGAEHGLPNLPERGFLRRAGRGLLLELCRLRLELGRRGADALPGLERVVCVAVVLVEV